MKLECTANSIFIIDFHMITLLWESLAMFQEKPSSGGEPRMSELTEEIISILHFCRNMTSFFIFKNLLNLLQYCFCFMCLFLATKHVGS